MLLQEYLYRTVRKTPDKEVLIYGENHISYGQLAAAAESIAFWINSLELEPGFRGALLTDDPFEYIAGYFGILIAGGVVVGLNSQTSVKSLQYHLDDCGASVLLAHKKFTRYFKPVVRKLNSIQGLAVTGPDPDLAWAGEIGQADLTELLDGKKAGSDSVAMSFRTSCDLAQIIYTSGTTGKPKGVMLRHSNLVANITSIVSYLHLSDKDRIMAVLPFFYVYGNSVMLTHIAVGGSLVVNQSFLYPNVILQQMVEHEVTGFSGVPSTFALLLNRSSLAKFSFPALRYLTQAGAAMSPALAVRLEKYFPGVAIYIMYGQTEASARLAYLEPSELHNRPGSIGKGIPGVCLSLLDQNGNAVPVGQTGEIVAQGENVMAGYWEQPEESAKVLRREGLWTGDLARQDEDGFFYVISRKSDIIKSGSHRIGPKEIEDTLAEHPAVHEAAVLGVADEILDERIRACIVLKDGCVCVEKELITHCRKELPAYKVPQEIQFFSELPKTATGKIKKTELKSL
ncbi:MAG TPA: AMP-dependent synthetase [Desulfobulbaceae bacterium]|nr:AMP-dependent synthetase [Desulfobulbaceae bacterium]